MKLMAVCLVHNQAQDEEMVCTVYTMYTIIICTLCTIHMYYIDEADVCLSGAQSGPGRGADVAQDTNLH